MIDIVGLQLYTVRDETAKDFKATIRRVAEIGYAGVEFAGYGELSSKEMHTLLSENGLQALGSHVGLPVLTTNFNQAADYCLEIECPFLVVPWLEPGLRNGAGFSKLAETLNELGQKSKERGLTLVYHNHDFEFQKEGRSTLLDTLLQSTNAELVKLEMDTYWAAYAGIDPVNHSEIQRACCHFTLERYDSRTHFHRDRRRDAGHSQLHRGGSSEWNTFLHCRER